MIKDVIIGIFHIYIKSYCYTYNISILYSLINYKIASYIRVNKCL